MATRKLLLLAGIYCILILTLGCNQTKHLSNNFFVLPVSKNFLPIKFADTSNPYEGYYVLNTNDTVNYRVFHHVDPLSEACPDYETKTKILETKIEEGDTVYVITGYTNRDIDVNRKQNIYYHYSKELNADYKITVPIDSTRTGLFGVYTDSYYLFSNRLPPLQMNVYVENPQKGSYKSLYKSFFKLSFIPFNEKKLKVPDAVIH